MRDNYPSPASLRGSLRNRAQVDAKALGVTAGDLIQQFVFQRLLARVFQQDGWMLKGGQALLVRYPAAARNSRDIDLFYPGQVDLDDAAAALESAATVDLNDHFRFSVAKKNTHEAGMEFRFNAELGTAATWQVDVDLVVRRTPTATPTRKQLTPAVSVHWPADWAKWPEVLLYPMADHVADKICAMYEWHGKGTPSTRYRDLADLLLISQREALVGTEVLAAIASERHRRPARGIDLRLPEKFEIPDTASWTGGYAKAARDVKGLVGCRTLVQAAAAAEVFVTPLLGSTDPGFWDPAMPGWHL